jgi:hypothetical protein
MFQCSVVDRAVGGEVEERAMIFALVLWVLCGVVGWKLGDSKGRPGLGLLLGFLLGLIGLVIVAFLPPVQRAQAQPELLAMSARQPVEAPAAVYVCRSCKQPVLPSATVCGTCGRQIQPTALPSPPPGTRAGWLRDPAGRFVDRYWDGNAWSEWVRNSPDSAEFLTDPPVPARALA